MLQRYKVIQGFCEVISSGSLPLQARPSDVSHPYPPFSAALEQAWDKHSLRYKEDSVAGINSETASRLTSSQNYQTELPTDELVNASHSQRVKDSDREEQPQAFSLPLQTANGGLTPLQVTSKIDMQGLEASEVLTRPAALPDCYELDVNAPEYVSPPAHTCVDFNYHITPSQATEPSPGYLKVPLFPVLPRLAPILEQAEPTPLAEAAEAPKTLQQTDLASGSTADGQTRREAAQVGGWTAPDIPAGAFQFANGRKHKISAAAQCKALKVLAEEQDAGELPDSNHHVAPPCSKPARASNASRESDVKSKEATAHQRPGKQDPAAGSIADVPAGVLVFASGRNAVATAPAAARAKQLLADSLTQEHEPAPMLHEPQPAQLPAASTNHGDQRDVTTDASQPLGEPTPACVSRLQRPSSAVYLSPGVLRSASPHCKREDQGSFKLQMTDSATVRSNCPSKEPGISSHVQRRFTTPDEFQQSLQIGSQELAAFVEAEAALSGRLVKGPGELLGHAPAAQPAAAEDQVDLRFQAMGCTSQGPAPGEASEQQPHSQPGNLVLYPERNLSTLHAAKASNALKFTAADESNVSAKESRQPFSPSALQKRQRLIAEPTWLLQKEADGSPDHRQQCSKRVRESCTPCSSSKRLQAGEQRMTQAADSPSSGGIKPAQSQPPAVPSSNIQCLDVAVHTMSQDTQLRKSSAPSVVPDIPASSAKLQTSWQRGDSVGKATSQTSDAVQQGADSGKEVVQGAAKPSCAARLSEPLPSSATGTWTMQLTTASGKPVAMATEGMAKAAALFADDGPAAFTPDLTHQKARDACFFLTAGSGKPVPMAKGNLARAAALLADTTNIAPHDPEPIPGRMGGTEAAGMHSESGSAEAQGMPQARTRTDVAASVLPPPAASDVLPDIKLHADTVTATTATALQPRPASAKTPANQLRNHGFACKGEDSSQAVRLPPSCLAPATNCPSSTRPASGPTAFKAPRTSRRFQIPLLMPGSSSSKGPGLKAQAGTKSATPGASRLQNAVGSTGEPLKRNEPLHTLKGGLLSTVVASVPPKTWQGRLRVLSSSPEDLLSLDLHQEGGQGTVKVQPQVMLDALKAAGAESCELQLPWVANSLRWVLWKLFSFARHCPALSKSLLSHAVALDELRKRYEWELHRGNQPVLKRLLEQDESPACLMVLCVASIKVMKEETHLELTDGWYFVRTVVDTLLAGLVAERKLQIGDKLRIMGAELSTGGLQSEALDAAKSSFLRIHYNGTHKMPHNTKLGRPPHRSVLVPLPLVRPGGGLVPRMVVLLQRKYPPFYWQRSPDGSVAILTPKAHASALTVADSWASELAESVSAHIQAEEVARCRAQLSKGPATPVGERLYAEAVLSGDAAPGNQSVCERHMAQRQAAIEEQRQERLVAEMQRAGLEAQPARACRNLLVSAVLHQAKACSGDDGVDSEALIRVWGTSEELDHMTEGSLYTVSSLSPSMSTRKGRLELHTTNSTKWSELKAATDSRLLHRFCPRLSATLSTMASIAVGATSDYQGFVLSISQLDIGERQSSQWLFLADAGVVSVGDWLLAVHLKASPQALDFLDPSTDAGKVVSLKDLRMEGQDTTNALWQASGNENSTVSVLKMPTKGAGKYKLRPGSAAELAEWGRQSKKLVKGLQSRIKRLLNNQ